MLTTTPRLPLPKCCVDCEFSFCIDARINYDLYLCTYYNSHVSGRAALCPWRARLGYDFLARLLGICVPPWQIAVIQKQLGDRRSLETIRNEVSKQTGLKLANIERLPDENPPPA